MLMGFVRSEFLLGLFESYPSEVDITSVLKGVIKWNEEVREAKEKIKKADPILLQLLATR